MLLYRDVSSEGKLCFRLTSKSLIINHISIVLTVFSSLHPILADSATLPLSLNGQVFLWVGTVSPNMGVMLGERRRGGEEEKRGKERRKEKWRGDEERR